MKIIQQPNRNEWETLCARPAIEKDLLEDQVSDILKNVRTKGDAALTAYSEKFDRVTQETFAVSDEEFRAAQKSVSPELQQAIAMAKNNIERFHSAQKENEVRVETAPGVNCWRKSVAIEKVGLYIPGGTAPLFSTILMLGIPAQLAGCKEVVLSTPPDQFGQINPAILYTAQLVGISKVYKVGGAQAIAAMAYGTSQIPQVFGREMIPNHPK